MIKIENECLYMENGVVIPLKKIHLVKPFGYDDSYVVNTNNGKCTQYHIKFVDLYNSLKNAGLNHFYLAKNIIINLKLVDLLTISSYKDNKNLSMFCTTIRNTPQADFYSVEVRLNSGWKEDIYCASSKEAEKLYHEIDNKLADLRSAELSCN